MTLSRRFLTVPIALVGCFLLSLGATACADERSGSDRATEVSSGGDAQISAKLRPVKVAEFDHPVEIKSAPGFPGLMFVVEQRGKIMVLRKGRKLARPFLNMVPRVQYDGAERGLLSVAFPPDYRRSKLFYVYFVDKAGNIRVFEYRRGTPTRARQHSARAVIRIPHPVNSNHNGGRLGFLGHNLYFGTGDGGGGGDEPGNAQDLDSLLGKLIRIDPRRSGGRPYSIPSGNPFVGKPGRDEIFSYGLRNPFRWSFDTTSSKRNVRIAIGDVGQDKYEEIDYVNLSRARGGNFGWNLWEGFTEYNGGGPGTIKPSLVLPHPPNCSVIGGLTVRDRALPALRGRYLFTDFCNGKVLSLKPHLGRSGYRDTGMEIPNVTSFGESLGGGVFVTSLSGAVYRIRQ
ncbi:MAG: PQQ-dependent sugar dehydrogenase [Solirubrobacterales bacterium]|nr:PQQ-dependent sugar dehydrogenase [Solirubrobacterales bacterium]